MNDPADRHGPRLAGLLGRDLHLGRRARERRPPRPVVPRQRDRRTGRQRQPELRRRAATTTSSSCPAAPGQVRLFDPMSTAPPGHNGHGGSYGAGDHWTGDADRQRRRARSAVTYRLYNTQRHAGQHGRRRVAGGDAHLRPGQRHAGRLQRPLRDADQPGRRRTPRTARRTPAHNAWVQIGQRAPRVRDLPPQRQHQRSTPTT